MSCNVRCWRCCFKHDGLIKWAIQYLNREMIGPQFIELATGAAICTLVTSDSKGRSTCLIYEERPEICRKSLCKRQQQSRAQYAAKNGTYPKEPTS